MNELIRVLTIFLVGTTIHELGHYVEYKRQKRNVKIYLSWYGIIMEDKHIYTQTPNNFGKVGIVGIILGLPFFYFIPNGLTIYLMCCVLDIALLLSILSRPIKERCKTYGKLLEEEYKEYKTMKKHRGVHNEQME